MTDFLLSTRHRPDGEIRSLLERKVHGSAGSLSVLIGEPLLRAAGRLEESGG